MNRLAHLRLALLSLALAGALGSCVESAPTRPVTGSDVVLRQGQSVRLFHPPTFLTFNRVVAESRCPRGALCIIVGEATVELTASDGSSTGRFDLTLTGEQGLDDSVAPPATVFGHRFQLFRLDPYPSIQTQLTTVRPVITLRVR